MTSEDETTADEPQTIYSRKCWNCGVAIEDENSRVCSDEICQRAEMKSQRGDFKHKKRVEDHKRWAEYMRKLRQTPEYKVQQREYRRRPEVMERRRERERKYRLKKNFVKKNDARKSNRDRMGTQQHTL